MRKFALLLFLVQLVAAAADIGETLFQTHCAPCHGPKGDGGRGANLAVRRLPHAPDDAALAAIIAQGIPGTQMPATRMTGDESAQLVAFVRGLGRAEAASIAGDRQSGERLFWSKGNCGQAGSSVFSNPVSYELEGKQYIAVTAGRSLIVFTVD